MLAEGISKSNQGIRLLGSVDCVIVIDFPQGEKSRSVTDCGGTSIPKKSIKWVFGVVRPTLA